MSQSGVPKLPAAQLKSAFQDILNTIAEGVCGVDVDGNATFCNEGLLKMTGFSAEELIGKNLHQLLHYRYQDGTNYPIEACPFRQAVAAQSGFYVTGEFFWRKDGTCFPVEGWVHVLRPLLTSTAHIITVQDISGRAPATQNPGANEARLRIISGRIQAEAMRASAIREEKFRRILANMPDVSWTSDKNGRTVYISPKVEKVLGYTQAEIYAGGDNVWLERVHPDDSPRLAQAYRALFETRQAFDEEYRVRRKDGSWIWLHDRAIHTHDVNGVLQADGAFYDITRRKQAEAELQTKTAFLEAQTNSTIDAILVVDGSGQRILQNQRFVELFKIPPEILANTGDEHTLAFVVSLVKDRERLLARVKYLYGHPEETSRDEIELKDGTFLDRYSSPVIGKNGEYYGRIWTFRDITERKRNEDTLQQLSLAVEQSAVSVVITDPQGNISYVNRKFTEVTGYTADEVAGNKPAHP